MGCKSSKQPVAPRQPAANGMPERILSLPSRHTISSGSLGSQRMSNKGDMETPITPKTPRGVNKRFQVLSGEPEIGRGGFSRVFKGIDMEMETIVAVKEATFDESNKSIVRALRGEFQTLSKLEHPNIVQVFQFEVDGSTARIFMEYMPAGTVRALQRASGGPMPERTVKRVISQALQGLLYLHSNGVLHRDIKPDNMLVATDGTVKLSDFGTCKITLHGATGTTTGVVGTVAYMSPESIVGKYSTGSDVWAIACTMAEMLSGHHPWFPLKFDQNIAMLFHIGSVQPPNHHPQIPLHLSKYCQDVLEWCFDFDPKRRPTVRDLLEHPFFSTDRFDEASLTPSQASGAPHHHHHHHPQDAHDGGELEELSHGGSSFMSIDHDELQ